jgi:RNA polymerase sigma-32 factor
MDARISGSDVSLNAPAFEGEDGGAGEKMAQLVDTAPRPDTIVEETIDRDRRTRWLNEAMQVLTARERSILAARRLNDEAATLECLGAELGISKERVRQIESRALEKLRKELTERQAIEVAALI